MRIINQTKNTLLAQDAMVAHTIFERMKGLLGRRDFPTGKALIIKPCNSIHTLFMRFPIDVLFVNRDNKVIKAIPSLGPFRLTNVYFKAILTIELPAGSLESTSTQDGDTLSLI